MLRFVCLVAALGPAVASAQLICPAPLHALGTVKSGTVVSHRFVLENVGRETVQITAVKTGCGCVRTEPAQRVLRPGEKTTLPIEVHTVTQPAGANLWGAELRYRTDSGTQSVLNVRLTAKVEVEVQLTPTTLVVHTAAASQHPFLLTERRATPLKLTSLTTSSPHVQVEASEPVRRGTGWVRTLRLVVAPTCPAGRHECQLTLATDDPAYPELRAPFSLIQKETNAVEARPAAHEWVAIGTEALAARLSVLSTTQDKPIVIDEVRCSHPAFRATWVSGPRATLRFVADREKIPAAGVEAFAEIQLQSPQVMTLKIPLSVRLK
jgi:hypothetical protein